MAILFKRRVDLSIITTQNERVNEVGELVPADDEIITINGARVSFNFTKSITVSPNRGIVKVWGLANSTVDQFLAGDNLSLNIGYQDSFEALSGQISAIKYVNDAESRILEFELIDGLGIEGATVNRTFAAGTSIIDMFKSLFSDVKVENLSDLISIVIGTDTGDESLNNGLTVSGPIAPVATALMDDIGLRWFNDGGIIKVIKKDGSTLEEVIEVSGNTGLIGSPERTEQGISFKTLLNTRLTPGRKVDLKSKNIRGLLALQSVRLEGDNEQEQPFYSNCEAVELTA